MYDQAFYELHKRTKSSMLLKVLLLVTCLLFLVLAGLQVNHRREIDLRVA